MTYSTLVFDAVSPKIASREFLPDNQRGAIKQHLTTRKNTTICMIERQAAVNGIVRTYLSKCVNSTL